MPQSPPRTSPAEGPACLDKFDREILLFALEWAPFGGPEEEDVFPRFGLTTAQLRERVLAIINRATTPVSSSSDRSLINRVKRADCWKATPCPRTRRLRRRLTSPRPQLPPTRPKTPWRCRRTSSGAITAGCGASWNTMGPSLSRSHTATTQGSQLNG